MEEDLEQEDYFFNFYTEEPHTKDLITSTSLKTIMKNELETKSWVPSEYHTSNVLFQSEDDLIVVITGMQAHF